MADFSYIAPNIIVGNDPAQGIAEVRMSGFQQYKNSVLDCLNTIWNGSWTGTGVIQGIAQKPDIRVVITPFNDTQCNADSNPFPQWATNREINIRFSPSSWKAGGSCSSGGPGSLPDEVLLHELVHAYRQMNGWVSQISLSLPGFMYENDHEFYSILLTNIHMSAMSRRVLRRDHRSMRSGNAMLYPELSSSEPFLRHIQGHRKLVRQFITDNPSLSLTICRDLCTFNPVLH
jgi:hypothetical protein